MFPIDWFIVAASKWRPFAFRKLNYAFEWKYHSNNNNEKNKKKQIRMCEEREKLRKTCFTRKKLKKKNRATDIIHTAHVARCSFTRTENHSKTHKPDQTIETVSVELLNILPSFIQNTYQNVRYNLVFPVFRMFTAQICWYEIDKKVTVFWLWRS